MATYTVLRLTPSRAIPLLQRHAARLGAGSQRALESFRLGNVEAGLYRVWWNGQSLTTESIAKSRLFEGISTRLLPSPLAEQAGPSAKRPAPSPYETVRLTGVATLLTSHDGRALFESCSAALIAWNGRSLVLVPEKTPRVASLSEAAVAARLEHVRAPIEVGGSWPILLSNAVVGTCAPNIERPPFPTHVRMQLDALLAREDT